MKKDEWRQVGIATLSKSGWSLNVCICDTWYSIKVNELRQLLEGWRRFAKVSAPIRMHSEGLDW
jgi:hypothetical protein